MWRVALLTAGSALACRAASVPLPPAGSRGEHKTNADDGAGGLAHQSIQLSVDTRDGSADEPVRSPAIVPRTYRNIELPASGGATYGGRAYAGWHAPMIGTTATRIPRYTIANELRGAIEGTVTWGGTPPGKLATACGVIDNPSVRVGANRALAGALVYIERVSVGRAGSTNISHPPQVGGSVIKHGCALVPTAQLATPVPVQLAVSVDTRARVVVTTGAPATTGKPIEVPDAGRALVTLTPGVTRIDAEDGTVVPAWIVVLDTPYYAITDDSGRYRLDELAPGTYDVTFWQAPLVTATHGKLAYGAPFVVHRTVTAGATTPGVASVILGR